MTLQKIVSLNRLNSRSSVGGASETLELGGASLNHAIFLKG